MFNVNNYDYTDDWLGSNPETKDFDYNSFYRAYVESIDDPEHLGRIKIRIPYLHQDTDVRNLPYAYPGAMTGLGNQVGQFILPPVGSIVFVTFEYSDEHRPIYFGGIPTTYAEGKRDQYYGIRVNKGESKGITEDDIPTEYSGSQYIIYKSPSGSIIYIDDNDFGPEIVVKDSIGQELRFTSNNLSDTEVSGAIYLKHDKDNYVKVGKDDIVLCVSGNEYHAPFSGGGGTSNYEFLINRPKLNTTNTESLPTLNNEDIKGTLNLHKVSKTGNYSDLNNTPTNLSQFTNDTQFITIDVVPTKTSDLKNDSDFITHNDLPTKVSDLENDTGFITSDSLPTKTSDLTNDSGFITKQDVPTQQQADWNESNNTSKAFIKNKPNLTVYEQTSNKVDISETSTSDQYPNAKSVYNFVMDVIAAIPQHLKVPVSLLKESDLPNTASTGDYYYIQDMDISAPGRTGRAWWNNNQWNKVIDQYQSMDGVSIVQNGVGSWKVSTEWLQGVLPVQEQSDWNENDSVSPKFIKNKPDIPTKLSDLMNDNNTVTDSNYTHTDNNYSTLEKNKLSNIEANAQVNVIEGITLNGDTLTPDANKNIDIQVPSQQQSNWNETDTDSPSFIKNKPDLSSYVKEEDLLQSDWNQTNVSSKDYIKNKPDLSNIGKQSDWNQTDDTQIDFIKNKPNFKTINGNQITGEGNIKTGTVDSSDDSVYDIITLTLEEYKTLVRNNEIDEHTLYNVIETSLPPIGVSTSVPIGTLLIWFGDSDKLPLDYIVADGSLKQIRDYPELFSVYGTTYGGDGETTFGLPNLLGKVVVQQDVSDSDFNTIGKTGGSKTQSYTPQGVVQGHTLTLDEMPKHAHSFGNWIDWYAKGSAQGIIGAGTGAGTTSEEGKSKEHTHGFTGTSSDLNKVQPYITGLYIIKAKPTKYTDDLESLDELVTQLQSKINELENNKSHIGMIIESTTLDTEDKVKALYGGQSWSKIEGRFLLGTSGSHPVNQLGGEEAHALTAEELPDMATVRASTGGYGNNNWAGPMSGWGNYQNNTRGISVNLPHNNMPPFKAVYIWERTA